ncbi:MAG TPA: DUF5117 domain-containing protein [Candidatus Handelsmanbacteria bacterium]|nr:DUF5117 domain-containing protein [Candidatus Handelsmanbacteria bacterium]
MLLLLAILCIFICWPVCADPDTAASLPHTTNSTVSAEEGDQGEEGESTEEDEEEEEEEEEEDNGPEFKEVVKGFAHIEGLFDLYLDAEENKVYLALEPGQFDKIYLCNISRSKGDGYFFDSASMMFNFPFVFERVGKKVFFTHKNVYYRADRDAAIHRAIDRLSDSVMGTSAIEGQPHPETGAVLIDPGPFFVQDIGLAGFMLGEQDLDYSLDDDSSYFGDLANFPQNTEIDVVLNYKTGSPKRAVPTLPDNRSFRHTYHYSLCNLPDSDFQPRLADDRVGHFITIHQDYTSVLKEDPYVRYIDRWHLEKAEAKFKRSKPKKPIVYWLENTIPIEYRDAVRAGVLVWNKAFEKIGYENAIVVEQQPDDATWDPADARYSTIRWMVQPGRAYAVGPSRSNPFTGQIYDADIRISADFIRYAYREFTEVADPVSHWTVVDSLTQGLGLIRNYTQGYCDMADGLLQEAAFGWQILAVRGGPVDAEEYIRQLVIQLVAHEVGHTLGLRHNFKASTVHSASQLHDAEVNAAHGVSGSVMDYNPVNIAPEGMPQGEYYQTTLGPYDYWAIEYAYKTIDADSPESERKILDKIAARVAEPDLAYGTDEDAHYGTQGIDPSATRWDLRDDPIAHYRDQMLLSRELWDKMEDRFEKKGARYERLRHVFSWGFRPYRSGVGNVSRYIGGIYHHRDHIGDPKGRKPLTPVPPAKQREALAFLSKNVFGPDAFQWSPELLNKLGPERDLDFTWSLWDARRIDYPIHEIVLNLQYQPLHRFYNPVLLQRLLDLELRYEEDDTFTMAELFQSLRQTIWAELEAGGNINSFRRNLQRAHLKKIIGVVINMASDAPEDARSLARVDLQTIIVGSQTALAQPGLDAYTQAHLHETQAQAQAALDAGLNLQQF